MNALRALVFVCLAAGPLACSSSSSSDTADSDAGDDDGMTSDETATFQTSGGSLAVNQEATALANSLFDFDPTVVPTATPSQNATAIGANISSNLGTSCGTVTVSGTTVTVAFGPPPGCTMKNGNVVSGTVDLGVSQSGATTTIALTLTDVVSDGESIDGTASFATTNGSTFAVTTSFTSAGKTDAASLTVTGASGAYTISGTSTVTEASSTSAMTYTGVTIAEGVCYASAGSMTITEGAVSETITFLPTTPMTGQVDVQIGKRPFTTTLPAYGSCPSDSTGRDSGIVGSHDQ
jgi:hypothetical protein